MHVNQTEWAEIVECYYKAIFAYAFRMLKSRADAEDLTQETFTRVYSAVSSPVDVPTLRPILYAIARNLIIDRSRWWKRWLKLLSSGDLLPDSPETHPQSISTEVLDGLPGGQREVFVLRYLQDLSTAETATLLGISEGTVKSQLKRAVGNVRKFVLKSK